METIMGIGYGLTLISGSNHGMINYNNLYNFLIDIFKRMSNEERDEFVRSMKIHLGMTFFENFKSYCMRKLDHNDPLICIIVR